MIESDPYKILYPPPHLCECGKCGLVTSNNKTYIHGHNWIGNKRGKRSNESIDKWRKVWYSLKDGSFETPPQTYCFCGCGDITLPGSKFIWGHHVRVNPPMHNPETVAKMVKSNTDNGSYTKFIESTKNNPPMRNPVTKEKYKNTMNSRYGVTCPLQIDSVSKIVTEKNRLNGNYERKRQEFLEDNPIRRPGVSRDVANKNKLNGHNERTSKRLKNFYITEEGKKQHREMVEKSKKECTDWDFYFEYGVTRSRYPYNNSFDNKLKEEVRNRDGNRCVITGMTNEEHKQLYGCNLHIHHWTYDKDTKDPYFLITVCRTINIFANSNKEEWMSLFGGIADTGIPWYEIMEEMKND